MYYEFDVLRLPDITNIYMVKRRTVWQIVDTDSLLIFVGEGNCTITADNRTHKLTAGSLFFVPARHYYIRRPVENEICTFYYAHVRFHCNLPQLDAAEARNHIAERRSRRTRSMLGDPRNADISHTYIIGELTDLSSRKDEIISLFSEAMSVNLRNHAESPTLEAMLVTKLLLTAAARTSEELHPGGPDELSPPDTNRKLHKVISYIRLHGKENISLDNLCNVCNFSKQHLIRVFSAEFGMTPKAYILEYRINCAKEMFFRNPHISVKEVADEMGFEDQHYFSRLFAKVAGKTPSDYKQHLINFDPSKQ